MMLVGNKTDMAEKRQVSVEEGILNLLTFSLLFYLKNSKYKFNCYVWFHILLGEQRAKEHDIMFIETSAKAGTLLFLKKKKKFNIIIVIFFFFQNRIQY